MVKKKPHGNEEPSLEYERPITYNELEAVVDSAIGDADLSYEIISPWDAEKYDGPVLKGEDDLIAGATVSFHPVEGRIGSNLDMTERIIADNQNHMPPSNKVWTHVYAEDFGGDNVGTTFYVFSRSDKWEEWTNEQFASVDMSDLLEKDYEDDGTESELEAPVGQFYAPEGYTWDDFGAHENLKDKLMTTIQLPLEHSQVYDAMGVEPDGILLYGPPGTGKTMIGRIAASEADSNFLYASGADIFGSLMGESEENVQQLFDAAREHSPTLLFIDEVDQISQERGSSNNSSTDRVVNQMLTEMDGMKDSDNVRVVGTTNRLDNVDSALQRKNRFGNQIEIPLPNIDGRKQILQIHTDPEAETGQGVPVQEIDYDALAEKMEGYSGADIANVVQTAAELNIRDVHQREGTVSQDEHWDDLMVTMDDVERALEEVESTSEKM